MNRWLGVTLASGLCLWPLLAECAEPTPQPVRLGLNAWPGYQVLVLAEREGCFAAQGLAVEIVPMESAAAVAEAFAAGRIDLMAVTLAELLDVHRDGRRRPEIVHVTDASEGADVLLARDGVTTADDLRGRRLGVEPGPLGEFMVQRFLAANGLCADDLQLVPMPQAAMPDAMAAGRVDAVVTHPPVSLLVAEQSATTTLFSSADIPGEVVDVVVADVAWLDARPDFVERLHAALEAAHQHLLSDPGAAAAAMAKVCGMSEAEWRRATAGIEFYDAIHQANLLWGSDRLDRVVQQLDELHPPRRGQRRPLPESFLPRHRPMPSWLQLAVPR